MDYTDGGVHGATNNQAFNLGVDICRRNCLQVPFLCQSLILS